jgi:hypothetical protein
MKQLTQWQLATDNWQVDLQIKIEKEQISAAP